MKEKEKEGESKVTKKPSLKRAISGHHHHGHHSHHRITQTIDKKSNMVRSASASVIAQLNTSSDSEVGATVSIATVVEEEAADLALSDPHSRRLADLRYALEHAKTYLSALICLLDHQIMELILSFHRIPRPAPRDSAALMADLAMLGAALATIPSLVDRCAPPLSSNFSYRMFVSICASFAAFLFESRGVFAGSGQGDEVWTKGDQVLKVGQSLLHVIGYSAQRSALHDELLLLWQSYSDDLLSLLILIGQQWALEDSRKAAIKLKLSELVIGVSGKIPDLISLLASATVAPERKKLLITEILSLRSDFIEVEAPLRNAYDTEWAATKRVRSLPFSPSFLITEL